MSQLNIVVLTYNNLHHTKKCLDHLYKYTKNFNLIVIDNNSTAATTIYLNELEKKHNNIVVEFNIENVGIIKGRNQGYTISRMKYPDAKSVCFLDNDQFVLSGWQDSYFDFFEKGYEVVGKEAWRLREKDFYPYQKINSSKESFNYVGCGCMMIREPIFEELGGFDEIFSPAYFEDPDFCFKAYQKKYKIGWNYNPIVHHQKHDLALRGNRRKYFMNSWQKFQEKWKNYNIPVFCMDN